MENNNQIHKEKNNKIVIAVDAMGGENSPNKIIEGIELSLNESKENYFRLYGNKPQLEVLINKKSLITNYCEIIHSENNIKDDESPLTAAKKGKESSILQRAMVCPGKSYFSIHHFFQTWLN